MWLVHNGILEKTWSVSEAWLGEIGSPRVTLSHGSVDSIEVKPAVRGQHEKLIGHSELNKIKAHYSFSFITKISWERDSIGIR